jgi:hypothetical protein
MSPAEVGQGCHPSLTVRPPELGEPYARLGEHFHDRGDGGSHSKPGVRDCGGQISIRPIVLRRALACIRCLTSISGATARPGVRVSGSRLHVQR